MPQCGMRENFDSITVIWNERRGKTVDEMNTVTSRRRMAVATKARIMSSMEFTVQMPQFGDCTKIIEETCIRWLGWLAFLLNAPPENRAQDSIPLPQQGASS